MLGLGTGINKLSSAEASSIASRSGGYLLDTYSGAAAAYSLRQLSGSYSGNAVKVRRSSDNTETDIGFVGGELDTASLSSFAGAGDAFVVSWFDQSSNSNDATQTVTSRQPQIVSSGAVIVDANGKPEMLCASDSFNLTSTIALNSGYSCIHVSEQSARNAPSFGASVNYHYITLYQNSNVWFYHTNAGRTIPYVVPLDTKQLHWLNWSGTNVGIGVDGAALQTGALSTSTQIDLLMRASGASPTWQGRMQEMIIFPTDQDAAANRTGIETNINTFYSIF